MDPKNRRHFCGPARRPVEYPLILLALELGIWLILNRLGELISVTMFRWGFRIEQEIKTGALMKSRQDRMVFFRFSLSVAKSGLPEHQYPRFTLVATGEAGGLNPAIICLPFARRNDVPSCLATFTVRSDNLKADSKAYEN